LEVGEVDVGVVGVGVGVDGGRRMVVLWKEDVWPSGRVV
jgi:hypothetical protein